MTNAIRGVSMWQRTSRSLCTVLLFYVRAATARPVSTCFQSQHNTSHIISAPGTTHPYVISSDLPSDLCLQGRCTYNDMACTKMISTSTCVYQCYDTSRLGYSILVFLFLWWIPLCVRYQIVMYQKKDKKTESAIWSNSLDEYQDKSSIPTVSNLSIVYQQ
jgi:hypothetical protein